MTEEKKAALKSKAENIWYYYKWYIIVGAFFLALAVIITVQFAQRKEEDMKIMIVSDYKNAALTDSACAEIQYFIRREYASDRNGDDEITFSYVQYNVGSSTADHTTMLAIATAIYSTDYFLIICDDTGYEYLHQLGASGDVTDVLEPLDGFFGADRLADKYRVSLSGTKLGELETINETENQTGLYACLRAFTDMRAQNDKAAASRFEYALDVLGRIINDRK